MKYLCLLSAQNNYFVLISSSALKIILIFFGEQYIIQDSSPKRMEHKKQKPKIITKVIKKNYRKDRMSNIGIILKIRKLKKGVILTLKIKTQRKKENMSDADKERKKRIYEKLSL